MKNISKLINQLKYAKKLHLAELTYRIREQNNTIKEKNSVIKALNSKKCGADDISQVKKIIKKWQNGHYFWIDLVRQNKKWAKEGGSISWHKKWIKVYQDILNYLNKK